MAHGPWKETTGFLWQRYVKVWVGVGVTVKRSTAILCMEGRFARRSFNSNNFATTASLTVVCALLSANVHVLLISLNGESPAGRPMRRLSVCMFMFSAS